MPKEIFSHVGLACCNTRDGSDRPATYIDLVQFFSRISIFYEAMIYNPTLESGQKGFVYAARHNFWLGLLLTLLSFRHIMRRLNLRALQFSV